MNPRKNLFLALAVFIVLIAAKEHPEAKLPFMDYCKFYNYPAQYHDVTTDDGYILRVFRIQKKGTTIKEGLKPIILQHGLLDSSDTWLINDQDKAPAFMLANAGYDVWLGNSRGNKHSRRHVKLNPDHGKQFWEFTFQHMADFDIPAIFSYIHQVTNQKIHYIGHSQGTVQMHIALAKQNPVVETLLDKYFGFGPVAYVNHQSSPFFSFLDKSGLLEWYHLRHIYELLPGLTWFQSDLGVLFCADFPKICGDSMKYVMDADPELDNYDRYDVLIGHDPSGTSVMNMAHWKQMLDHGQFRAYDYGSAEENRIHYGQTTPPLWPLNKVQKKIRLFVGSSDELADITDVDRMWSELDPSVKQFYKVYKSGHCTFIWGRDETPWMTDLFKMLAQDAQDLSMIEQ